MKGCGFGKVDPGEYLRAMLEEFNKLSDEDQIRLLARNDQYSKTVRAARVAASGFKVARGKAEEGR